VGPRGDGFATGRMGQEVRSGRRMSWVIAVAGLHRWTESIQNKKKKINK